MTASTHATRVLIVEDQGMFRSFLERWLGEQIGFELVGTSGSGEEALALVPVVRPDVALVDMQLPGLDGIGFARAARQIRPHLRTLILSSLTDSLSLTRVRESGVEGYVEKDAHPQLLQEALVAITAGKSFYSPKFQEILSRERSKTAFVGKILSRREQEVLTHVLAGKTSREISAIIGLSPRTVEFHRANIMTKLGTNHVTELLAQARRLGLI